MSDKIPIGEREVNLLTRLLLVAAWSGEVKVAIAEFAQQHLRYPSHEELEDLGLVAMELTCESCSLSVVPGSGQVMVVFDNTSGPSLEGKRIVMTPPQTDLRTFRGAFSYSCESTAPADMLPALCSTQ